MNNELCCFLSGSVSDVSEWGCDMAENLLVELQCRCTEAVKSATVLRRKKSIKPKTAYIGDWTLKPCLKMNELISYIY